MSLLLNKDSTTLLYLLLLLFVCLFVFLIKVIFGYGKQNHSSPPIKHSKWMKITFRQQTKHRAFSERVPFRWEISDLGLEGLGWGWGEEETDFSWQALGCGVTVISQKTQLNAKWQGRLGNCGAAEPKLKEKVLVTELEIWAVYLAGIDNKARCIRFGSSHQELIKNNILSCKGRQYSNYVIAEQTM